MQLSLDGEVRGDLCFYFCLYSFQYFAVPPPLGGKVAFGGKVLKEPCTMLGQSPAVTSKSNTYCFCITTRRKRLAAFLKGGRIQSRATKPVAEVRAEGSHLGECEGLPATQDRPRSAHRHLHSFTSQHPHRSNPALSSGHTENHHQKKASTAQNKPNQDFWLNSGRQASLPEQIPTCHPQRHSDTTYSKAQVLLFPGEDASPNGTRRQSKWHLVHPKACPNNFIPSESSPSPTSLSSPAPQAMPFLFLFYFIFWLCHKARGILVS